MKDIANKQHGSPSNRPAGGDVFAKMLEAMTEEELTDGLNEALESMTEENYDPALIDAYLAALDRKAPMPEVPDTDSAFTNLKNKLIQAVPAGNGRTTTPKQKAQSVWRIGLIAALTVICLMGGMVVAQAAGVDVFGAIARWTDEVFSFAPVCSEGADDGGGNSALKNNINSEEAYGSLQEALDDCGITELHEPTWIPEGYALENIEVDSWPADGSLIGLYAEYYDGINFLQIHIECCNGDASIQAEKTDAPIESFQVDGLTVYLLENVNSHSAAWATEHYECYISGAVDKHTLKQMVFSAYAHTP